MNQDGENKDFQNEQEQDPTKEAFFADMDSIEEEVSIEAYSLVEHALGLLEGKYFDDSIEILRQAIGLYDQINKQAEIAALKNKIDEIQLLKEASFKERLETEALEMKIPIIEPSPGFDLPQNEIRQAEEPQDATQQERLKIYEEIKQKEEFISNEAFGLMEKAKALFDMGVYDDSLRLYEQSESLLNEINWTNEAAKIKLTMENILKEKNNAIRRQEEVNAAREKELQLKQMQEKKLEQASKVIEDQQVMAQAMRLKEYSQKRLEDEMFKERIAEMVNHAEKISHKYEIDMKKAIKEGNLIENSMYPEVIKIYEAICSLLEERGWYEEKKIYLSQIEFYEGKLEQEAKLREVEAQKALKEVEYEKLRMESKIEHVEVQKPEPEEIKISEDLKKFKKDMDEIVKRAEKLARDYDKAFKKAIKKGELYIESKYPEVLRLYTLLRDKFLERGLSEDAVIYSTHIRKYQDLLEKEEKIRAIEIQKLQREKEFEEAKKMKTPARGIGLDLQKMKDFAVEKTHDAKEQEMQSEIENLIKHAEMIAREYDLAFKQAIKDKNFELESKYPEIIEIYGQARSTATKMGWTQDAMIYSTQIRKYTELYEKEKQILKIEEEKIKKEREFENLYKKRAQDKSSMERVIALEEQQKAVKDEEYFETEIDQIVDSAEKRARDYELLLKKGEFEVECPYIDLVKIYEDLYHRVLAKGWGEEAKIYLNQSRLYQDKYQKDKRLREVEAQKIEERRKFDMEMKTASMEKATELEKMIYYKSQQDESEIIMNEAMNLINKAEKEVRSYELSLKKNILNIKSPYNDAIINYEKARDLFKAIGWEEEANRLSKTINFYKEKRVKDENLRAFERAKIESLQRPSISANSAVIAEENVLKELESLEFEKERKRQEEQSQIIFELINRAENIAKEYEINIRQNILDYECPYEKVIEIYREAKKKLEEFGWKEEAAKLLNPIRHYQEKLASDKKLRTFEKEKKVRKEELQKKSKVQAKLAREAESELLKQKAQALEVKKKKATEYDNKKQQAFNLMDIAKKELSQNMFDQAIRYYKESEKLFSEIDWNDGVKMAKESINIIIKKREAYEMEKQLVKQREVERLKMQAQIEEEISKAKELKKLQEEQRKQELLEIERQKAEEMNVSEQAYKLLEEGTKLKDDKKYDAAYEKYILARDLFNSIAWNHEVSRINNDLLFILKKEMKQEEKIKAFQQKKVEEKKELEILLQEAELKRQEMEQIKKEEKRIERERYIQEEWKKANSIIKTLRYNQAIVKLKRVQKKMRKIENQEGEDQITEQIDQLSKTSKIPLITLDDYDDIVNKEKFEGAYNALDEAQISLSNEFYLKAISEFNEAIFNLKFTDVGLKYIPLIEAQIELYKNKLGIKVEDETGDVGERKIKFHDEGSIRGEISARRRERRDRIKKLLKE
jgi:hypothetical protein